MRCKACNSQFQPYPMLVEEGIVVEEELCGKCLSAVYDSTYEPEGQPTNLFEELNISLPITSN